MLTYILTVLIPSENCPAKRFPPLMQLITSIWLYHNAFMLHQNMHLVVNGCRWFACLEIFTQPYTNI